MRVTLASQFLLLESFDPVPQKCEDFGARLGRMVCGNDFVAEHDAILVGVVEGELHVRDGDRLQSAAGGPLGPTCAFFRRARCRDQPRVQALKALISNGCDQWLPALLIFAGTTAFIGAGRLHPKINASLGAVSTEGFARNFAAHMLHAPHWQEMHFLILLGPVLWALASAGLVRLLPARALVLTEVGPNALLLGSGLWAIAFVLDGYLGPRYAQAMVAAGPGADSAAIATFTMNQFLMARLGLISIVLLALGTLAFGAALLFETRVRSWRGVVGVLGLLVGTWPLLAAMRGEFWPGPFTSQYWTLTALAFGVWFLLLGTVLPGLRVRPPDAG